MKRRLYFNILMIAVSSVILTSILLSILFYQNQIAQMRSNLISETESLLKQTDTKEKVMEKLVYHDFQTSFYSANLRISLIQSDGKVIYDSRIPLEKLDNHSQRSEVRLALQSGEGSVERYSNSLQETTYYYAKRLSDYSVLRLAATMDSIYRVWQMTIMPSLAVVIVISIVCIFMTRRIIHNIEGTFLRAQEDEDVSTYIELQPLFNTITHQKKEILMREALISRGQLLLETIIDAMKEGLIVVGAQGEILSLNPAAKRILSLPDELSEYYIHELALDTDLKVALEEGLKTCHKEVQIKVNAAVYQLYFSEASFGTIVLLLDITQKFKAEKRRRQFTANVSHELKTPLTTILGFAELMSCGVVPEKDIVHVSQKMKKESNRLIHLIEEMLYLAELDESDNNISIEQVDINAIILDVLERLEGNISTNNLQIYYNSKQQVLYANRRMMFELVHNLIENAIKYNKKNGEIRVDIEKFDGQIVISIQDTGLGIESRDLERIFERFYRGDRSRSQTIEGTGLGLAIVKHIVMYHGGSIEVQSEAHRGSKFVVTLPTKMLTQTVISDNI